MKTCLTCGAMVADNADVCPDCGMEMDATSPANLAPAMPAPGSSPAPSSGVGAGSGFTVDFGFDDKAAPPAVAPVADSSFVPPVDAGNAGSTVVLDPISSPPSAPAPPPEPIAPAHAAQITLIRAGAPTSESFRFGPGSIVGRFDPDSGPVDVDLAPLPEASYVSRHHIEFRYDGGSDAWFVKDMGSRNGTFWRGGGQGAFARLSGEQALQSGDEIALGNARFEFKTL